MRFSVLSSALAALCVGLALATPVRGDTADSPDATPRTASLEGTVTDTTGAPVAGASVRIAGTTRRASTDSAGRYRVEALPPGRYRLEAESARSGSAVVLIDLAAGAAQVADLELNVSIHHEEIVVTATPDPRSASELGQSTTIVSGIELLATTRATLGETVAEQPGVNQTFFGPGASRPVIRGVGGDRIRVLVSGLGSGDASTTSPDHAVAFDPMAANQIEIVRGPATLLFGSSAVGGVVNLLNDAIPNATPAEPIAGAATLYAGSAADSRAGSVAVDGGSGRFAYHLDGFRREDDDYDSGAGTVPNSAVETAGGNFGASFVSDDGFFGASYGTFDSTYGNPAEAEAGVHIDLDQRRYQLAAGLRRPFGIFDGLDLRLGRTDYDHAEIEGDEVGTLFLNDSDEARLTLPHRKLGAFRGTLGVQFFRREFSALGEEAFVPPTDTDNWAAFLFEEVGEGALRLQLGLRYESQDNSAAAFPAEEGEESEPAPPDRSFSGVSASTGLVWNPGETWGLAVSVSRSEKLPNAEELYSNGPHLATSAFEIGDPNLDVETSVGAEVSLRKRSGKLRGALTLFGNRFDDYIFEQFTGEVVEGEEDELRVVRFVQTDAEFRGAELEAHLDLLERDGHLLELEGSADFVRAEERGSGAPLPRIPPRRFSLRLRYQGAHLFGSLRGRWVSEQDRVSEFESATPGHDLLDAEVGYRLFVGDTVHDIVLTGTNLTDEVARDHVSFLKDVALLPGRDLRLAYRLSF